MNKVAQALKLNVLLGIVEHKASQFKKLISDYATFFKSKQGEFKGVRKTYTSREGMMDEPNMRGNIMVVTTVEEKLNWMEENADDYINKLFSIEATNASGAVKAPLVVGTVNFGELSSLELLRLKSFLEKGGLEEMYASIPVRSDSEVWDKTDDELYHNRNVYEQPQFTGVKKTIVKEPYILKDLNVEFLKNTERYVPQTMSKDTILELGDYTVQNFSGELTHRERAEILKRRSDLLTGVIEALKKANEAPAIESTLTAQKLFNFLHRGKI